MESIKHIYEEFLSHPQLPFHFSISSMSLSIFNDLKWPEDAALTPPPVKNSLLLTPYMYFHSIHPIQHHKHLSGNLFPPSEP